MTWYLWVILGYLLVLAGFNFYRSRKVKSQEDFMVAGRKLSLTVMVFTLVCTWIGSGSFIAGAEYAVKAGWSSLWLPAGAWVGIAVIYFLAAKIRGFGQYTVGDILEVRYGKFARIFGALALIIAFTPSSPTSSGPEGTSSTWSPTAACPSSWARPSPPCTSSCSPPWAGELGKRFDKFPNLHADVAARTPELQRQPAAKVRRFCIRYQDRLLYGTDADQYTAGRVLAPDERAAFAERMQEWYRLEFVY